MSFHVQATAASIPLEPSTKLVLMAMADCCNTDGICWPSYNYLTEFTGLSRRTIIRHVNVLVDRGIFIKQEQVTDRGSRPNIYHYRGEDYLESIGYEYRTTASGIRRWQKAASVEETPVQPSKLEGCHGVTPGVTQDHPGGDTVSPKPTIEPTNDPTIPPVSPPEGQTPGKPKLAKNLKTTEQEVKKNFARLYAQWHHKGSKDSAERAYRKFLQRNVGAYDDAASQGVSHEQVTGDLTDFLIKDMSNRRMAQEFRVQNMLLGNYLGRKVYADKVVPGEWN